MKVKEKTRKVVFNTGKSIYIDGILEVDNSGTFLCIVTDKDYYLINTDNVLYYVLPAKNKVF